MGQKKSKTQDQEKGSKLLDIPPDSLLGIMIRNWNERGPKKGKSEQKLIQYCMVDWTKKPLKPHVFWPTFGSFEDWTCQALNTYINSKEPFNQEESDYAQLWIRASRPYPASIFVLKKHEKSEKEEGDKSEERTEKDNKWEPLDNLPPLYFNNPPPVAAASPVAVISPPLQPTAPEIEQPPAARTRSRTAACEETPLYPLWEVPLVGNQGGIGLVAVPLNTTDVRNFKKEMGTLLDDPLGVAKKLDQFLGPNTYTWEEIQSILGILFTAEERGMIRQSGMRIWERQNMRDLRMLIIQGIKEAVPHGQNINKAFNEQQGKEESPTEWLERLRKSLQMYSGIDPNTVAGTALLRTQFVAKSWGDIRRKLVKLEDFQERGLEELLRESQKVYVRRDEEKQKTKTKIFVAAVRESQKNETPSGEKREKREKKAEWPPPERPYREESAVPICYYFNKKGHIKRNCCKWEQDERMFQEE
uniref:Core shell protein Gag P30 domain-containing protein n=1 Tax=Athene cunicularia TaxID=194338 RepID=A0A663LQY9_ATHCN